ncbi:hypothetical protein QTJ16_005881 [Diplocarpon rosae]|uniref:Uncharacterized protein n=1 Tax=Diplocarpon rosae TaxID=946125 RepID=A0AAD9SX31_9HELO|nr:hypothetical protein QTJ16_005881 [Diplocarpon rosae]
MQEIVDTTGTAGEEQETETTALLGRSKGGRVVQRSGPGKCPRIDVSTEPCHGWNGAFFDATFFDAKSVMFSAVQGKSL